MARTKRNAMNIEEARQKIQTTQLVKRLTDHVFDQCKMSQTQVQAALGLLKKTIPDLKATEITGQDGGAVQVQIVKYNPDTQ